MPSKKYCIVKDFENQSGGYMKYKIITNKPRLILGPPVVKFTGIQPSTISSAIASTLAPSLTYTGAPTIVPANISIISDRNLLNMSVPLPHLRSVTNNIFKYARRMDPYATFLANPQNDNCIGKECKNRVKFLIKTPTYSTTLRTNYSTLTNVVRMLDNKYSSRGLNFYDPSGNKMKLQLALNILQNINKMQ
jgi:hypothetical protein